MLFVEYHLITPPSETIRLHIVGPILITSDDLGLCYCCCFAQTGQDTDLKSQPRKTTLDGSPPPTVNHMIHAHQVKPTCPRPDTRQTQKSIVIPANLLPAKQLIQFPGLDAVL